MDLSTLSSFIPAEITFLAMLKFIGIATAAIIIVCLFFRLLLGRKSALNKAICAAIGVLCIYILTIVVYTLSPGNLERFLVPLPFVKFSGQYLYIMVFSGADFSVICTQILNTVILVLLYNLADSILPDGDSGSAMGWFALRILTITAAMLIHYGVTQLTGNFLPELLVAYGPVILLICLVGSVLMGLLSLILSLVLSVVNPVFGLLFTFFFRNKFGMQISKAMLTTFVLTSLVVFLGYFGYSIICISIPSLISYIPLLAVLTGLWYSIGKKL